MASRYLSFWNIKQVNARYAEQGGKPNKPPCPACGGLGIVKEYPENPSDGYLTRFIKCPSCTDAATREWLMQNCGLEGQALGVRFTGWAGGEWPDLERNEREDRVQQRRVAWKFINRAIKNKTGLLTFWGDFGSGKTHALTVVVNECRDQLVEAYYAPLATVLDHLRLLYSQRADSSNYWQRLLDVPVLCLDEVTRFNATPWAREKLFVLADTRYRRRASHLTVFATNESPRRDLPMDDDLGYLFSRMREGAVVELRGDMRPAAGLKDQWWEDV